MIDRVNQSSIPQDDTRHDGYCSRRRPRKRPAEAAEEPEDSFSHSLSLEEEPEEPLEF